MAKFYVQSGPIRVILTADAIDQAALAALDRLLQQHHWIYDDPGLAAQDCRDHLMLEALLHLEPTVRVSEKGFDRRDAARLGTPETVDLWHCLMVSVSRLFVAAGLAPRHSMMSATEPSSASPRRPR